MLHLGWFGENYADRILAIAEVTRFTVYGNPSDQVKEVLNNFGAVYMAPFGGFAR